MVLSTILRTKKKLKNQDRNYPLSHKAQVSFIQNCQQYKVQNTKTVHCSQKIKQRNNRKIKVILYIQNTLTSPIMFLVCRPQINYNSWNVLGNFISPFLMILSSRQTPLGKYSGRLRTGTTTFFSFLLDAVQIQNPVCLVLVSFQGATRFVPSPALVTISHDLFLHKCICNI